MNNYYFTFGSNDANQPFRGGWVIVKAVSQIAAITIFNTYFPNRKNPQICNCAVIYTENEFVRTQMYQKGNFGRRCHGIIGFKALKNKDGESNEKSTKSLPYMSGQ